MENCYLLFELFILFWEGLNSSFVVFLEVFVEMNTHSFSFLKKSFKLFVSMVFLP